MFKKIRLFVIMCLFIGAGFTQLSAQSDNKAISSWEEGDWICDVFCDGEWVDFIQGHGTIHFVAKFKKGELIWQRTNSHITATGLYGENFKYIEQGLMPISSLEYPVVWIEELKYQLHGDQGHHYLGVFVVKVIHDGGDDYHLEFFPGRSQCL